MPEDYEKIEGIGQIPSAGFGPALVHLNESGTASRNDKKALVESPKADKEAEQKNNNSRNNRFGNIVYPKWRLYKRTFKQENRRGLENTYSQENVLDCHCNFSNIIDTYSNKYLGVYQE